MSENVHVAFGPCSLFGKPFFFIDNTKAMLVNFQWAFPKSGILFPKEVSSDLLKEHRAKGCLLFCISICPSVKLAKVILLCLTTKTATVQVNWETQLLAFKTMCHDSNSHLLRPLSPMLPLILSLALCVLLLPLEATGSYWPKVTWLTVTEYDVVIFLLYYILAALQTTHMTAKV